MATLTRPEHFFFDKGHVETNCGVAVVALLLSCSSAGRRVFQRRRGPGSILCPANHYNDCLDKDDDRGPLILKSKVKA